MQPAEKAQFMVTMSILTYLPNCSEQSLVSAKSAAVPRNCCELARTINKQGSYQLSALVYKLPSNLLGL